MKSNYTIQKYTGVAVEPIIKHYEDDGEPFYLKVCCPYGCHVQVTGRSDCPKCGHPIIPMTLEQAIEKEHCRE